MKNHQPRSRVVACGVAFQISLDQALFPARRLGLLIRISGRDTASGKNRRQPGLAQEFCMTLCQVEQSSEGRVKRLVTARLVRQSSSWSRTFPAFARFWVRMSMVAAAHTGAIVKIECRVHQRNMRESLGKVAYHPLVLHVVLFR